MDNVNIDLMTVVVAAALNMVVGYLWYSNWLFGRAHAKMSPHARKDCSDKRCLVYTAAVSLVIAYFLAFFEAYLGITTVTDGMFVGFCAWLGFVATTQVSSVIWGRKPLKLFMIRAGGTLVSYLVMGGVIGA